MKIRKITANKTTEVVYNLATPPIQNYVANGIVVHNCYQDSTPEGEHALMSYIDSIAGELYNMRVLEVAIGGGEPTLHPEFAKILRKFRDLRVVPNFTTKRLDWVYETSDEAAEIRKAVVECGGAFAYSVTKAEEVEEFVKALKHLGLNYRWGGRTMCIHVIPELMTKNVYTQILTKAAENGLQVTLLGLKHTGRGANYQHRVRAFDWLKVALELRKTHKCPRVAVDTALARSTKEELTEMDPYQRIWFMDEGGRSMYVDAVKQMAAPSSYSDPATFVAIPRKPHRGHENGNSLLDVFQALPIES